jgi:hypothetical protein
MKMTTANIEPLLSSLPTALADRMRSVVKQSPEAAQVFVDLHLHLMPPSPSAKKRKLEQDLPEQPLTSLAKIHNLSVLVPYRKKLSIWIQEQEMLLMSDKQVYTVNCLGFEVYVLQRNRASFMHSYTRQSQASLYHMHDRQRRDWIAVG